MQRLSTILFASLSMFLLVACSDAATPTLAPFVDVHAELGKPFNIGIGNTAFVGPDGFRMDITGVEDSRCPPDSACLRPNVAMLTVSVLERDAAGPTAHQLFFDAGTSVDTVGSHQVQVLNVAPDVNLVSTPADYVVTFLVTKTTSAPTLDARMTATAPAAGIGEEVTYTASADGSGLAQYTLLVNGVVVGITRHDGSLVRSSQTPIMELVAWKADADGASWTVRMLAEGAFAMTALVTGEVRIGDGEFAFASGASTRQITVE